MSDQKSKINRVRSLIEFLEKTDALPETTPAEAFFKAHQLAFARTSLTSIIKSLKPSF